MNSTADQTRQIQAMQVGNRAKEIDSEPQSVSAILRSLTSQFPIRCSPVSSPDELKIRSLWVDANAPKRHDKTIDDANSPTEWVKVRDHIIGQCGSGFSFALLGKRGTGKTQIAIQAMLYAVRCYRPVLYVKAMEIFLLVRATYHDEDRTELDAIKGFLQPALLVIDEAGERAETAFEDRQLVYIIDKRYDAMLDTILIANMREKEFRESMGPSIADRMRETGGVITCEWESFRQTEVSA